MSRTVPNGSLLLPEGPAPDHLPTRPSIARMGGSGWPAVGVLFGLAASLAGAWCSPGLIVPGGAWCPRSGTGVGATPLGRGRAKSLAIPLAAAGAGQCGRFAASAVVGVGLIVARGWGSASGWGRWDGAGACGFINECVLAAGEPLGATAPRFIGFWRAGIGKRAGTGSGTLWACGCGRF